MNKFHTVDTPAVIIDYNKMMKNLEDMKSFADSQQLALRPMIKTHKIPEIAKLQVNKGAIGITCAKIGEAEVMADEGIKDIFIAYEIVSRNKIERLIELNKKVKLSIAVDSEYGAELLNESFKENNMTLDVLIEINSGLNRCGLDNTDDIISLAEHINKLANVRLIGLFTHAGHAYGAETKEEIEKIGQQEGEILANYKKEIEEKTGLKMNILSTGSTPTVKISGKVNGINEIRPGNYVFYDSTQVSLGVIDIDSCALSVIATVISKPSEDRAVIDAGSKTLALDKGAHGVANIKGYGTVKGYKGVTIERLSEEHGILSLENDGKKLNIGDKIEIIPNHACSVVNLFDEVHLLKDGEIANTYIVKARGKLK